jgi:hypothetical protein
MVKANISSDVIVAKIKVSRCNFDTDPSVLSELKHHGVSNEVLKAMIEAAYGPPKIDLPVEAPTVSPASDRNRAARVESTDYNDEHITSVRAAIKALRKLKSASDVGVSYVNYGPLVVDAKTEVDDALAKIPDNALRGAILKSMQQYEFASEVWNRYWQSDFVDGEYKNIAVNRYGVKKKGLLRVVWRSDFVRAIWNEAGNQFEIAQQLVPRSRESNNPRHVLTGAWSISVTGNETLEFTLTVEPNGSGVLRTPQGNAPASISCANEKCSISASDTYKKRLVTIRLDGTLSGNSMEGTAQVDDGKQSGSFPFKAVKLGT